MITLDTNIVVRILVDDVEQPEQTQKARALDCTGGEYLGIIVNSVLYVRTGSPFII
jgi:hypothetical protein